MSSCLVIMNINQDILTDDVKGVVDKIKYGLELDELQFKHHVLFCLSDKVDTTLVDTELYDCIDRVFLYHSFSYMTKEFLSWLDDNKITKLYFCGVGIDRSIFISAASAYMQGLDVEILANASYSLFGAERRTMAIALLDNIIGKGAINTDWSDFR